MTMHSILIVDDEPNYLVVLSELLKDEGFEVFTADDGSTGLKVIEAVDLDVMPGMDGLQLLHKVKERDQNLPVVVITVFAEVDKAVQAMQAGAFNYLAKPFSNDELIITLKKAAVTHLFVKTVDYVTRLKEKAATVAWSAKIRKWLRCIS